MWTPDAARVRDSAMARFAAAARRGGAPEGGPAELHAWSVTDMDAFWRLVWQECGVLGDPGATAFAPGSSICDARFFPDASLSVAENLLAPGEPDDPAVIAVDEAGARRQRTRAELRERVARLAGAFAHLGVGPGDRVAAWLPNGIEALETMLAAASLGAVFTSASPDFGAAGVLDRFGQVTPKLLVAIDGYRYAGRDFDCLARLAEIRAGLPGLRATLVVGSSVPDGCLSYESLVASGEPLAPRRFGFDHPWYVLYSSGTTGVPKCIVHRAGGVLLMHAKEHRLHCDVRPGDRVAYFTTTGWMMWNWLVSALATGAAVVLYDGSPTFPSATRLFDLVDAEGVTLLGVSAKYVDSLRKTDVRPVDSHRLESLRTICSTGSPLSPEGFDWVYDAVKPDVHLASISGGTDLCGCFVGGDPTRPVTRGEIQGPMLGMDVDVVDAAGASLREAAGELVCRGPFPSVPLGFWGDGADGPPTAGRPGPRFRAAYFERIPGLWAQGDFATIGASGGVVIHGRSDTTLNPGGVRIGTAEIYRAVEAHPDVLESLVFGWSVDNDVEVVLLVRLREGVAFDGALADDLRGRVRTACTPRHVPRLVLAVDDLPRTRSNKLVELAVADAVNGRPVRNAEAVANPEAIWAIAARPELGGSGQAGG